MQTLRRSFFFSNRFVRFSIFCTFPLSTKSFLPKSLGFSKLSTTFAAESRVRPIRSGSAGLVRRLSIKPQTFAPTIELREVIAKGELSGVMRAVPGASSNSFFVTSQQCDLLVSLPQYPPMVVFTRYVFPSSSAAPYRR